MKDLCRCGRPIEVGDRLTAVDGFGAVHAECANPVKVTRTVTPRAALLREAERLITTDRNGSYGEPADNFGRIAAMWSAYLGRPVSERDVTMLMVLLKVAREAHGPIKDTPVDIAGYAGLAAEFGP